MARQVNCEAVMVNTGRREFVVEDGLNAGGHAPRARTAPGRGAIAVGSGRSFHVSVAVLWRAYAVGACLAAAVLGYWCIVGQIRGSLWELTWAVMLCPMYAAVALAAAGTSARRRPMLRRLAFAAAVIGTLVCLPSLVFEWYPESDRARRWYYAACASLVVTGIYLPLVRLLLTPPDARCRRMKWWRRSVTVIASGLWLSWCAWAVLVNIGGSVEARKLAPFIAALTILLALFIALLPLARHLDKTAASETPTLPSKVMMHGCCPRCGRKQAFTVGRATCRECGLRIYIEVEEPRCHCGYLLYKLTGRVCPECGRQIPSSKRARHCIGTSPYDDVEPDTTIPLKRKLGLDDAAD